jgi:hypothetical protein
LATRVAEIAALPIQSEKADLWRRLNRLDPVRPMVMLQMLEDSAWPDTGVEDALLCTDPFLRRQELLLRRLLYQWEHQAGDMVIDSLVAVPYVVSDTGIGLATKRDEPDHWFGASRFVPVIVSEEDAERIRIPLVTVDQESTERLYQQHCDLYGDILDVRKTIPHNCWFDPFDEFVQYRGIEQAFMDMMDRPAWLHGVLSRMTECHLVRMEALEARGALTLNNGNSRIGPGGLGFTDELPQPDFAGQVRLKDLWGTASTQIFSGVSPAMHEEFALQYESRLLTRFGLSCYGCCEPLHHKVEIARRHLPNLRRISMSPWADVAAGAEAIGKDLVLSYKPNPAAMAGDTWDIENVRAGLRDVLEKTRGCSVEVLMKDLHTCHGRPERMWEWTQAALELAEEFAN